MASLKHVVSQKNSLEQAVEAHYGNVASAKDYLTSRGITGAVAQKFRLGVVSSDSPPEHRQYAGRLCIPYLSASGPIGVKYRCIREHDCKEAHCPKYLGLDEWPPLLFNSRDLLADTGTLVVTEGELDAITISGILGLPCVAYPGTESWRPYFNRAISTDWERILVVADGDKPGREAARSVARHFPGLARVWRCPDGEDANSLLLQYGAERLREAILSEGSI